jgi:hypothetical protein
VRDGERERERERVVVGVGVGVEVGAGVGVGGRSRERGTRDNKVMDCLYSFCESVEGERETAVG